MTVANDPKSAVKEKLSGGRSAASQERRKQLLDELQEIRNTQGNIKQARSKVFDQLKALQDGVQKKVRRTYSLLSAVSNMAMTRPRLRT